MQSWDDERERRKQEETHSQYWSAIVCRVAEIERAVGTAILRDAPGRDSMQGVSCRLAFLTGYLEERAERGRKTIDITPEPERDDGEYETAGNLICLPGVKLTDVRPHDGGRA